MKTRLQVQYKSSNIDIEDMERVVKEALKEQGIKMNTISTLQLYYKPEDFVVYYVVTLKDGEVIINEISVDM